MATTTKKKQKQTRKRKPMNFGLFWVTETEAERDDDGNPVDGTERRCLVEMPLPPGLDEAGKRSRDAIERATKKAVYESQLTEYGNKTLIVASFGDTFAVPFERVTVTKLLPPEKAEKVRQENGKDCCIGEAEKAEEEVPVEAGSEA